MIADSDWPVQLAFDPEKRWTNHATNQRSLCNDSQVIAPSHAVTMTTRKHFLFVAFDCQLKMEDGSIVSYRILLHLITSDVLPELNLFGAAGLVCFDLARSTAHLG